MVRGRRGTGGNTLDRPAPRRRGCSRGATPVPAVGEAGARPTWGIGRSPSGPIAWPAPRGPRRGRMCVVRILLWHGYLLGGTGSNVYTRQLAREWSRAGHEVTVLSQERRPEDYDLGGAATVRPDVGGFLPVFVLDRYEGFDDVRRVPDCTREELERWVDANAAAVRALLPADLVFTSTTCCSAARSGPRRARRSPSRRTARSSSTRCAGAGTSAPGGRSRSRARARRSSARATSARW